MPKVSEVFPSQYLNAEDLGGARVQVQVATVEEVEVSDFKDKDVMRKRLLVGFVNKKKKMLVGIKNAKKLAESLGDDTAQWIDRVIEVYAEREEVAGTMRDVLKVSIPQPTASAEDLPF